MNVLECLQRDASFRVTETQHSCSPQEVMLYAPTTKCDVIQASALSFSEGNNNREKPVQSIVTKCRTVCMNRSFRIATATSLNFRVHWRLQWNARFKHLHLLIVGSSSNCPAPDRGNEPVRILLGKVVRTPTRDLCAMRSCPQFNGMPVIHS